MSKTKKLHHKISKKLDQLHELIDKFDEVRLINSANPTTWDSDILYNLTANLKKVLQLLEDKKHPKAKDPWGEPLILEEGLGTLVDEYHSDEEAENENYG